MGVKVLGMPLAVFLVVALILLLIFTCVCCIVKDKIFGKKPEQFSDIGKRGQDVWFGKTAGDREVQTAASP